MSKTRIRRSGQTAAGRLAVASLGLLALLQGCGYKGPLYLPPPAPPDSTLTSPPDTMNPAGAPVATPVAPTR